MKPAHALTIEVVAFPVIEVAGPGEEDSGDIRLPDVCTWK
jgi:hypothetical protein